MKDIILVVLVIGILVLLGKLVMNKKNTKEEWIKMSLFYRIFNLWLSNKQQGKGIENFFYKNGYKKVAIYGVKELGERLYDELQATDIQVLYFIDKRAADLKEKKGISVLYPNKELLEVDVIVITADYYFVEIEKEIGSLVNYPVYSLEDILLET